MEQQQPQERKKTNLKQLAKILGWRQERVRAYYMVGLFPKPIREPGEGRGGFWYQEAVEWMVYRRDHVHEFRIPKFLRDELEKILAARTRSRRSRTTKKDET